MNRSRRLDIAFQIAVTIKGIDGVLETIGGSLLFFVSQATLHGIITAFTTYELAGRDKHAFITNALRSLDHHLNGSTELFIATYLLVHGLIKVLLVTALIRRHYRLYPLAIVFLLAFIVYQAYLIGYNHSAYLVVLTAFDSTVAWLTYLEYRRHQAAPTLTA